MEWINIRKNLHTKIYEIMETKIEPLIDRRWSPRAFSNKSVEAEKIALLFTAASYAASCYNEQPWRFVYATKESHSELYEKLFSCMVDFNQQWAKTAPMLLLTLTRRKFKNTGGKNHYALHDLGMAMGNMVVQAQAMDLYLHHMGGFSKERARKLLSIPNDFEIGSLLAIGYTGDPDQLPEKIKAMENNKRERRELDQLVFQDDWDKMLK